MNTPAHLIIGAAAFAQPEKPFRNTVIVFAALLPDLSLYLMVMWNSWVRGLSPQEIFGREYFSSFWQSVFAIDNSIPLWLAVLIVGLALKIPLIAVFATVGLMHLALDFPLHHDDGRSHFWPFTDWKFESPVSYWDPNHYGGIVGPIEGLICLGLLVVLWLRFRSLIARALIVIAGLLEMAPAIIFPIMFSFGGG